ncbi:hypothetical protein BDV98DRAFT_484623, partial [Pterulicium gracile]
VKQTAPPLFSKLNHTTIWRWMDPAAGRGWSAGTLSRVTAHGPLKNTGRAGLLQRFPDILAHIKKTLQDLRDAGIVVNVAIARPRGIIESKCPEILSDRFQCSEAYVRGFLPSVMNFSPRAGTRAAKKLSDDAEEQCKRAFFRIAQCMRSEGVPA